MTRPVVPTGHALRHCLQRATGRAIHERETSRHCLGARDRDRNGHGRYRYPGQHSRASRSFSGESRRKVTSGHTGTREPAPVRCRTARRRTPASPESPTGAGNRLSCRVRARACGDGRRRHRSPIADLTGPSPRGKLPNPNLPIPRCLLGFGIWDQGVVVVRSYSAASAPCSVTGGGTARNGGSSTLAALAGSLP